MEEDGLRILSVDFHGPAFAAAEAGRHFRAEGGEQAFPDAVLASLLEGIDPASLLLAGRGLRIVFVTEAEELAVEGNVHILGKAVDEAIDLRKRGAALENEVFPQIGEGEQRVEGFADPVVLFQNRGREAALLRGVVEKLESFAGTQ
jgi:hypothetical protein